MTKTTTLIATNVDRLASTGGLSNIQDSPVGASGFGSFSWPLPEQVSSMLQAWQSAERASPMELGRQLYDLLLAGRPGRTMPTALERARAASRVLLAFSTASPEMHLLPFEILHDGDRYLAGGERIPFRWINDGSTQDARSHGFRHFLVAVANPTDHPDFDHDRVVGELRKAIDAIPQATCNMVPHATRGSLRRALGERDAYDAVVIVAHGGSATAERDGFMVLEDESGAASRWVGEDVAHELGVHRGCLVVLCSCKSGAVTAKNSLGGVAQRLMIGGHVGSVVAMQRPVTVSSGLAFLGRFLGVVADGTIDVFDAYGEAAAALAAHADWERGTAALYTRLRGRFGDGGGVFANIARPSEEEIIRTSTLLSADQETSRFAFSLPRFKLGSPEGQPGAPPPEADDEAYRYRGPTIAANDVQAVEPLIQLVGRFLPKSEDLARRARIIPGHVVDASFEAKEFTHYVLVGSRSHDFSRSKLPQYSRDFAFEFTECGPWRLIDRREGIFYDVANPALAAAPTPNVGGISSTSGMKSCAGSEQAASSSCWRRDRAPAKLRGWS